MLAQKSTELWTTMQRETGRNDVDTFLGYVETALVDSEAETHDAVQVLERIEGVLEWRALNGEEYEDAVKQIQSIIRGYFGDS